MFVTAKPNPNGKKSTKKATPINGNEKDVIVEPLADSEVSQGFIQRYYPPSRHLRAAQAAATTASVYTTTSKQQRQQQQSKDPSKKLTAGDVEEFLKREGYIEENAIISDNFEDPYVDLDKWRFHDSYRRDSACRRAVNILADFTLGQRTKNTLDLNKQEYTNDEQQKMALDAITNNPTYQAYTYQLDCLDKDVNFDHFLTAAFVQAKVFGRAMLLIQDDPQTELPVALKLVSSMRLGRVFIDEMTWRVVAVEYLDYEGLQSIIPAENMIYFTNLDNAISPNVYGFGYSDLEPAIDVAEINRQLWSVAIKEINKSEWAPYIIVKMNTKRRTQMQKVADALKPGLPFVHNQDLTFSTIEMHHDLEKIMNEIDQNEKTIATTIGVPTFLVGKEDVTNRATTATIMDSWSKSKLEKERTWLRGIIEPQWNDRNLKRIIKSGIVEQNLRPDQPSMMTMQYTDPRTGKPIKGNVNPNNPFAFGDNGNRKKKPNPFARAANAADNLQPYQSQTPGETTQQGADQSQEDVLPPSRAIDPDTPISKLEFKIKREFEPFNLDVSLEIAQPVVSLVQAGVIDETKAREWLKAQDIEARMQEKEAENKLLAQQISQGMVGKDPNQQQKDDKSKDNKDNKDKQQQKLPFGGSTQSGGIKQVGESAPSISLSAEGSYLDMMPNTAMTAAARLRMQADKKRMQLYDEISSAVRQIAKN